MDSKANFYSKSFLRRNTGHELVQRCNGITNLKQAEASKHVFEKCIAVDVWSTHCKRKFVYCW